MNSQAIIKRAGTKELIRWAIKMLADMVMYGNTPTRELSSRKLSGRGMPGGKGIVDLCLAKKEVAWCLLTQDKLYREIIGYVVSRSHLKPTAFSC